MAQKFEIKNDILTTEDFSKFLAFALKGLPASQRLKIKMNLEIIGPSGPSESRFERLINKIKTYV